MYSVQRYKKGESMAAAGSILAVILMMSIAFYIDDPGE
jgi:hypothetical protein